MSQFLSPSCRAPPENAPTCAGSPTFCRMAGWVRRVPACRRSPYAHEPFAPHPAARRRARPERNARRSAQPHGSRHVSGGQSARPSAAPGRRRRSHARGQRPHPAANAGNGRVVLRRRGGNGAYSPGALDLLHRQLSGAAAIAAPRFPAPVRGPPVRRACLVSRHSQGPARHERLADGVPTCGFSRG